jgi:hypothetical protein
LVNLDVSVIKGPNVRIDGKIVRSKKYEDNGSPDEVAYQDMLASEIQNMVHETNIY